MLVAAFLVLQGAGPSPALLIVISLGFGVADAAYAPASNSLPVQMVPGDQLIALAGVRQLINRGAVLAGAPLGGAIVAIGGLPAAVLVDAVSFAVIAVALLGLHPRFPRAQTAGASLLADVRAGLAYVRRSPPVRDLTVALSGLNVFVTPVIAIGLAQHVSRSGWGSGRLGLLTGLIGAGAAVGTIVALRWRPPQTVRIGLVLLLAQAAALASLGVTTFAATIFAVAAIGLTAGLASPLLAGAFQQTVDQRYLGRCNSLITVADAALAPLALVLFGWLTGRAGLALTCAGFGAGFGALLTWSLVRSRPPLRISQNRRAGRLIHVLSVSKWKD